jgi:hypothetical protein
MSLGASKLKDLNRTNVTQTLKTGLTADRIDINNLEREFVEILTNAVCTDIYLTNNRA